MKENKTYNYYISYSRNGVGAARYVKTILTKYGKTVLFEDDVLSGGVYTSPSIEKSEAIIVILNDDSLKSKWLLREIRLFEMLNRPIIPIEFSAGVLNKLPESLHFIKKWQKITYTHNPYDNFEKRLCLFLGLDYKENTVPTFSFNTPTTKLIRRDKIVDCIYHQLSQYNVFNLVGIGGSGKTSLVYLLNHKYGDSFSQFAYVVVNKGIKEDFVSQINSTLKLEFEMKQSIAERYDTIVSFLDKNYDGNNNLLVLDINRFDQTENIEFPKKWKTLIVSRTKFGEIPDLNIDDETDTNFLKELFKSKAGENYADFDNFDGLFKCVKNHPLLIATLGIYLSQRPKMTFDDIMKILGKAIESSKDSKCNKEYIELFLQQIITQEFSKSYEEYIELANWQNDYLKDYKSAEENYIKAIEKIKKEPREEHTEFLLANAYKNLANLQHLQLHNFTSAKENYQCAIEIGEQLPCYNAEYLNNLASTYNNLANLQSDYLYDHISAKCNYEKAISIYERQPKDNPEYLNNLANSYNNLAVLQANNLNDYDSALENYHKAIEIRQCMSETVSNPEYLTYLASNYNNLAHLYATYLQDYQSADSYYKKAVLIRRNIVEKIKDVRFVCDLAQAYDNRAIFQYNCLKDYMSAEMNYKNALEAGNEITKLSTNANYLNILAGIYIDYANYQNDHKNDYVSTENNYSKALDILSKIKDTDRVFLINWIRCKLLYAILYLKNENMEKGKTIIKEITPLIKDSLNEQPNHPLLQQMNKIVGELQL